MTKTIVKEIVLRNAVNEFEHIAGNIASHANVENDNIYPQPYTCKKCFGIGEESFRMCQQCFKCRINLKKKRSVNV